MFNNFVNVEDLQTLIKQGPKVLSEIISRLGIAEKKRIKTAWSHSSNPPKNWWDIPVVRSRWNHLISGDPQVDYYDYISQKYLANKNSLSALSIGCGTGHRELRWAETSKFSSIDAYDLSHPRIQNAISIAKQNNYDKIINYRVSDVYGIKAHENHYDVVLGEQSLHHFSPLEKILLRANSFLKTDGYFIVNEFVGPTRFQWTERQLEAVNGLLAILPAKYKTFWGSESIKQKVSKPSRLRMILQDPSEAIESSKIKSMIHEIFDVVEVKEYGGTILQLLFNGISHNFLSDDPETQHWLKFCFDVEDQLIASNEIQSDFIVAICKKRS